MEEVADEYVRQYPLYGSEAALADDVPNDQPLVEKTSNAEQFRWLKGKLLGVGAFAKVYLSLNLDNRELMAVKEILLVNHSEKDLEAVHREVGILSTLQDINIVQYFGSCRENNHLYLFLEFVSGGSIASMLAKNGPLKEGVVRAYTRQILMGLRYLHKRKILHRDIKGANILVDHKGVIKLADFGSSKKILSLGSIDGVSALRGTPYWMAPEVIRQEGVSSRADIWSVACTVIEMITGKPPWSECDDQVTALFQIAKSTRVPIPEGFSTDAKDFLSACFRRDPEKRPSAEELLLHPFVAEANISVLYPVEGGPTDLEALKKEILTPQADTKSKNDHLLPIKKGSRVKPGQPSFDTSARGATDKVKNRITTALRSPSAVDAKHSYSPSSTPTISSSSKRATDSYPDTTNKRAPKKAETMDRNTAEASSSSSRRDQRRKLSVDSPPRELDKRTPKATAPTPEKGSRKELTSSTSSGIRSDIPILPTHRSTPTTAGKKSPRAEKEISTLQSPKKSPGRSKPGREHSSLGRSHHLKSQDTGRGFMSSTDSVSVPKRRTGSLPVSAATPPVPRKRDPTPTISFSPLSTDRPESPSPRRRYNRIDAVLPLASTPPNIELVKCSEASSVFYEQTSIFSPSSSSSTSSSPSSSPLANFTNKSGSFVDRPQTYIYRKASFNKQCLPNELQEIKQSSKDGGQKSTGITGGSVIKRSSSPQSLNKPSKPKEKEKEKESFVSVPIFINPSVDESRSVGLGGDGNFNNASKPRSLSQGDIIISSDLVHF
eukprot:TRINITY_DN4302_c0_g1_i1.p1 TRINITY_DN4302_c0_g1~~TRINITY_DN4302_c0_g1_i1.p1  ORF type:complete len:777 (-),score=156.12 TRINITY_DN4302_c0_g1_i1:92-2422(-)